MRTPSAPTFPSQSSGTTIVSFLYVAFLLSFMDRVIFSVVMTPVKRELGFSDAQLGFLAGGAFAVTYAAFAPIAGIITDRLQRKAVLLVAVLFWSAMTAMTGLASSFLAFAVIRAFVGVGETFLNPLAVSLIGDSYPPARRARVYSLYLSAAAAGGIVAFLLAGLILHVLAAWKLGVPVPGLGRVPAWRMVFVIISVPGLLLVLAIALGLREPARISDDGSTLGTRRDDARPFFRNYWPLLGSTFGGLAVCQLGAFAFSTWGVVFLERVHHWDLPHAAIGMGLASVTSLLGCFACGRIIDAIRRRGIVDGTLWVGAVGGLLYAALASAAVLVPGGSATIALGALAGFFGYMPTISCYASIGDLLPAGARGRFTGLGLLITGVVINTIGPLLVGELNDRLFSGPQGLRESLLVTIASTAFLGALLTLPSGGFYRRRMRERALLAPADPVLGPV